MISWIIYLVWAFSGQPDADVSQLRREVARLKAENSAIRSLCGKRCRVSP